ncbi:hypothetical protein QBC45DRAFT_330302, partial [Copromyces sp. CBS 386.78]
LNSDTTKDIYKGIAHLVDNPTELHHTLYWSNSMRTTSSEYVYFVVNNSDDVRKAIFPLDFIYFQYFDNKDYTYYLNNINRLLYISCIKIIGKNYSKNYIDYAREIILII